MKSYSSSGLTRLAVLLLSAALLAACAPAAPSIPATATPDSGPLTVMAAASLTGAFTDLGKQFEAAHPGVTVQFNFAGSQQLAQQLGQGAAADVFASANQKQMGAAVQAGRVEKDAARVFARNRLVVVLPKNNPAGLNSLSDLSRPGLKLVFAAKEVPVGQYSLDFLDKAVKDGSYGTGYQEKVLANVVSYEENVKSVLVKVALGEADAGIVYTSDVTGPDAQRVQQIAIPDALNVIAEYPIAALKDSPHAVLAAEFVELVLSPAGQTVLAGYGLLPATQ